MVVCVCVCVCNGAHTLMHACYFQDFHPVGVNAEELTNSCSVFIKVLSLICSAWCLSYICYKAKHKSLGEHSNCS